ncbi:MAG: DUF58 domain-containing protein [Deltaproteobacteria bacterium]|nr:DUF58 domain-containing protein [Deltaproteobacteria bacterium]
MRPPPHPIVSLAKIAFHLVGTMLLPIIVGFIAALFLEVSEVADTAPALLMFAGVYLFPILVLQVIGIVRKVRLENRERRDLGTRGAASWLEVFAKHVSVVTPRGWGLLGAGVVFLVVALAVKWGDVGTVAVLALLLFYGAVGITSFLSAFLVRGFRREVERQKVFVRREMSPAVIISGEPGEERFHLSGVPVPPGYCLLIDDRLPDVLATETRHVLGAGIRSTETTVSGRIRRTPRGLYRLGPASIWYQDLLGLTHISVASVATCELKVLPRFRGLDIIEPPRSKHRTPDVVVRPHRFPTEDFFRFREYARGDDTRRIHWKLSVRAGRLQLRLPESREMSVRNVVLALDSFLPARDSLDAVGLGDVLDRLVETWISLAAELVDRGESVTLVAAADDGKGNLRIEQLSGRANRARWQDLGARVRWQAQIDLPALLADVGKDTDGVAVSARFDAPPPEPFPGQSLAWIYHPPEDALGPPEPSFWKTVVGKRGLLSWLLRLPHPVGSDENTLRARFRDLRRDNDAYNARLRLRMRVRHGAQSVLSALVARGDAVYKLQPGPMRHRIVGVSAGRTGGGL